MKKTIIALMAAMGFTALTGAGATPNFFDNFDGYAVGTNFTTIINGWQTSAGGVMVTNDAYHSAPQSVTLPGNTTLTNTVNGGGGQVIWTDLYVKPALGVSPPALSTDSASLCLYFNTNGYVTLVTTNGEQVFTNDVWGGTLAPATTNFVRVTVYQNYATSNQAVLVDGHLAAQDLPFITPASAYNTLALVNGSSNAWADDVWVKTTYALTNTTTVELATYGYAARTQYVGTGSGQPQYPTFQAAISAWRPRDTLYVYAGTYTNDVLATNSLAFTGSAFTNMGSLTISTNASVSFQSAMTWGNVTVNTNATAVFGDALTCSNLVVAAGSTATFYAVTCSNVYVAAGAHATFLGALACAGTCTLDTGVVAGFSNTVTCSNLSIQAGAQAAFQGAFLCTGNSSIVAATVAFNGTVSCGGIWLVDANANVTVAQSAVLATLNVYGTLTLAGGGTLSANSATVTGLVQVAGSGTVTVTNNLTVTGGGQLQFTSGHFVVVGSGVDMSGTFTINNTWGQLAAVPLPFTDDFELYTSGTRLVDLGFHGWGARDTNVVVQSSVFNGGARAAVLPGETAVSNRLSTTGTTHLWTDFYLRPQPGLGRPDLPTNGASFVAYVDTNGWLEVASPSGWLVCSNLFMNCGVPQSMTTQTWSRVTVFQDFVLKTEAVFVNGQLVLQQVPFLDSSVSAYSSVEINNNAGQAYLDDIGIRTNLPPNMDADIDGDGYPDAREIDLVGSISLRNDWVHGTTFKFR